jgi:hypothetical protein
MTHDAAPRQIDTAAPFVNVRLYANTSSLSLTERLEGGGFQPPTLAAYSDIHIRFKLTELFAGAAVLDKRELTSLSARIGRPDTAPVSGSYQLTIALGGDEVTTAAIAHDATSTTIAAAINAALGTTIASLNPCTVTTYEGIQRIAFADKDAQPVITCEENALWPASFVDIDEIEWNEGFAYILQLRQAPVAETEVFSEEVPAAPVITRLQGGSEVDGTAINEVQKLAISPAFAGGSFRVVRSGVKSDPIVVPTDIGRVRAALEKIKDDGGAFVVTEVDNGIYIEFGGTMAGTAQDLMTVQVFESPGPDYFFTLPTRTDSMRTLMRSADETGQLEVPLNLVMEIYDSVTDTTQDVTIIQLLRFARPVASGEYNVAATLRWTQPLSRTDYQQHSNDSLVIGNRARKFVIGDGTDTSFALPHNLVENTQTVTVNATTDVFTAAGHGYQDLDPITFGTSGTIPAGLTVGTLYFVRDATEDTFKVSATPNGTAVDVTTTGTGTHTTRLKDGTVDGILVEVWATGGSKQRLSQNQYTAAETSLDLVTLSGFPATPTTGQYKVLVMTYGRPATYQHHSHEIDETPEARDRIEALEAAVAALQLQVAPATIFQQAARSGVSITRHFPRVWTIPRARTLPADPGSLRDWNPFAEGSPLRDLRLLPAVHVASSGIEVLPTILPAPSATYRDRVFYSPTERIDFPGGTLPAEGYAACDGRDWYRVRRETEDETTWYPTLFEVELFRLSISPDELALRSRLDLLFGFEAALFAPLRRPGERRAAGRYSLLIERGVRTTDASPATTGSNIDTHFTGATVLLRHDFDLTEVPVAKRFGVSISRTGAGVLAAEVTNMLTTITASAPASADFVLRARLARPDFEDLPLDARGVPAFRGLDVGLDGVTDQNLGLFTIA